MLIVGILVLWLALSPRNPRTKALKKLLGDGTIGGLPAEKAKEFESFCTWVARGAGFQDPVRLNTPPTRGAINIYTSTPKAEEVTHCSRGNAVYDADLDSIFLDLDLVLRNNSYDSEQPWIRTNSFAEGAWSSMHTYLAFILLHELGHRELHARNGGMFDVETEAAGQDETKVSAELEADRFALEKLIALYKTDLEGEGKRVGFSHREPAGLLGEPITDDDRVWNDLLGLPIDLIPEQIESDDPYSPLHVDIAHPAMVTRVARLFGAAEQSIVDADTRELFSMAREQMKRMEAIGSHLMCELTASEDIAAISLGSRNLLLASPTGGVYRIPIDEALGGKAVGNFRKRNVSGPPSLPPPGGGLRAVAVWTGRSEDEVFLLGESGEVLVWRGHGWTQEGTLGPSGFQVRRVYLTELTDGGRIVYAVTGPPGEMPQKYPDPKGRWIHRLRPGAANIGRDIESVTRDICRKAGLEKCRVEIGPILPSGAHVLVYDATEEGLAFQDLAGVATLDHRNLAVSGIAQVALPDLVFLDGLMTLEGPGRPTRQLAVMLEGDEDLSWGIWDVTDRSRASRIVGATSLVNYVSEGSSLGPYRRGLDPNLVSLGVLEQDRLVANFMGDSLYLVNLRERSAEILFHPGGGLVSGNGRLVAFLPTVVPYDRPTAEGRRCYLIKP